jgi:aspartyl aminopeptidase
MSEKKSVAKKLAEKLLIENKNLGLILDDQKLAVADEFCEDYKRFLDVAKTEREATDEAVRLATNKGFEPFEKNKKYSAGDKFFYINRGKAVILCVMGSDPIENGVNIVASHIDSPRIDLKPRPLYEEAQFAMFKTHYYGGIKKYQWTAVPLALHGVIVKKGGETVVVNIGEDDSEPVFCVTDLLPHLASEQMKRTLSDGIRGEDLNVLIGSRPFKDDEVSEKVKLNIINILHKKYGIDEYDLLCAELELVPAYKARDIGFDRSMLGAYGQDDRVCAYTSLIATLNCNKPKTTMVTILADKEEAGSDGNTGLKSAFLRYFIADIAKPFGVEARDVLSNSKCLSADVNAAYDPTYPEVSEKRNTAYLNYGVVVTKYTGCRGKGGTSDASAEFMGEVRDILNDNDIVWQTGELGKVDAGGGGTVAAYVANLDVDVIDVGVPVLSMHSPFEVVSKLDVFMAYKAFLSFFSQR